MARAGCSLGAPPALHLPTAAAPPHPAPQDPWFRQFLPDLSKLAVAQAREQQSVAEITRILQVGAGPAGGGALGQSIGLLSAERVQQRLPAGVLVVDQVRGERIRPKHIWLVGTLQHAAPPANVRCCTGGGPAEPAAHAAARRLCRGGAGGCTGRRDGRGGGPLGAGRGCRGWAGQCPPPVSRVRLRQLALAHCVGSPGAHPAFFQ